MAKFTDIDKRIMKSLFNSGQMTPEAIADEYKCQVNFVKQILAEDVKPNCCDRLAVSLSHGREIIIDIPCYGTTSYDDVTAICDAIFFHYFPNEPQEVGDI